MDDRMSLRSEIEAMMRKHLAEGLSAIDSDQRVRAAFPEAGDEDVVAALQALAREQEERIAESGRRTAARLLDQLKPEHKVFVALMDAAVDAHPAWRRTERGWTRPETPGIPLTPEALVDWYKKTHPLAAEALEARARGSTLSASLEQAEETSAHESWKES